MLVSYNSLKKNSNSDDHRTFTSNYYTIAISPARAFAGIAQIESDAILAGYLTTDSILSAQQMVKW